MSDTLEMLQHEADDFRQMFTNCRTEIGKLIVGQERVVECALTAMFCGGNILLEGVPGLGKTELVKAMGQVLDLDFRRILEICRPYLGHVVGEYTEWQPLVERSRLFPEDLDETDPWQFKNVRVV